MYIYEYYVSSVSVVALLAEILFHLWRYSPFWALVSLRKCLQASVPSSPLLHPRNPRICDVLLQTTFAHLVLGYPTGILL